MTANESARWAARATPPQVPPGADAGCPGHVPVPAPVLVLSGTIGPSGPAALCRQVTSLLAECQAGSVICDVGRLGGPGMAVVGALARLTLAANRLGVVIRFQGVRSDLLELIVLAGLDAVVLVASPARPAQ